jgi:hypothetical protein
MRDEIRLDDIRSNQPDRADYVAVLQLETSKSRGFPLDSYATIYWVNRDDLRVSSRTMHFDFKKCVHTTPCARATQKAIAAQHAMAFSAATVEGIIAEARAHYANRMDDPEVWRAARIAKRRETAEESVR